MVAGVMPKRAAVGRSITMSSAWPWTFRSLVTAAKPGVAASRSTSRGTHAANRLASGFSRKNWYCARLTVESTVRSCTGCIDKAMPGTGRRLSRSRSMTASTVMPRSACGFRLISSRPAFSVVLVPSTPMKEDRLSTAGSCSTASASTCWRAAMAEKDVSCAASEIPWMTPVSCTGKKPLGIATYIATVAAKVSSAASNASSCRSSTQPSQRPYPSMTRLNPRSAARSSRLRWSAGRWRTSSAHIMGTSVSDTTADSTMVTDSVTANSLNSRPTTSPMNSSGISTAIKDTVSETMVKPISSAPRSAASNGASPSSTCRAMFSIITMASSTTNPVLMVSAIRDRLSRL